MLTSQQFPKDNEEKYPLNPKLALAKKLLGLILCYKGIVEEIEPIFSR